MQDHPHAHATQEEDEAGGGAEVLWPGAGGGDSGDQWTSVEARQGVTPGA